MAGNIPPTFLVRLPLGLRRAVNKGRMKGANDFDMRGCYFAGYVKITVRDSSDWVVHNLFHFCLTTSEWKNNVKGDIPKIIILLSFSIRSKTIREKECYGKCHLIECS
jgi:hypothetical protein